MKFHVYGGLILQSSDALHILIVAGLRPGLLQKYAAANSPAAKFEFIRAFMLDPANLADINIEAFYVDLARHEDESAWVELPLSTLKKRFTSPEEVRFLQERVVNVQEGRPHPQDPDGTDRELRLYWIYDQTKDTNKRRVDVGHRLSAKGEAPANRAAMQAVADGLLGQAADFDRASGKGLPPKGAGKGNIPNGWNGKGERRPASKADAKKKSKKAWPTTWGAAVRCIASHNGK